jgi:predicted Zn-dependent protease
MPFTVRDLEPFAALARREGARGVELMLTEGQRRDITLRRNGSPMVRRSQGVQLSVRAWDERGAEGHVSGAFEGADTGAELIRDALAAAAAAAPLPFAGPVELLSAPARGLDIDDRRHPSLTDADIIEVLADNDRAAAKASRRVETRRLAWRDERETRLFLSSAGAAHTISATRYDIWLDVAARDGALSLSDHISGRAFASTATLPFAALLVHRADDFLNPGPTVDGPIRVLFPSRPMARLCRWLADHLTPAALGSHSSFLADHAGEQEPLFHRRVHLVDDGQLPGGLLTRAFDDRGVPPEPVTLLREGRIEAPYLSLSAARAADARPSGHEIDGVITPSNLIFSGGVRTINVFLSENPAPVFLVDDLEDLTGLNAATGTLDVPVRGMLIEGGKRQPVPAARLRGSLITALQQVVGVASDTDRHGQVDAPAVFVDGLAVTSA